MKKLLLILLFYPALIFGQSNSFANFLYSDGSVIWQKIYQTELSNDDIINYFQDSGIFINNSLRVTSNSISGETKLINPNYDGADVKKGNIPIMFKQGYKGFVIIELKEGRYRVTMSRGVFVDNSSITIGSVTKEATDTSFDYLFNTRKDKWKSFFVNNGMIVNYSLEKSFLIIKDKTKNQDW